MKHRLATIVFALPLALAGCSGVDGFRSEEAKQEGWDLVKCDAYVRVSTAPEMMKLRAENFTGDDKEEALTAMMQMTGADTMGDVIPRTGDTEFFGDDVMCEGWVWEWYKSRPGYMDGYEDFTHDQLEKHIEENY